jgi:hypothetical protein
MFESRCKTETASSADVAKREEEASSSSDSDFNPSARDEARYVLDTETPNTPELISPKKSYKREFLR